MNELIEIYNNRFNGKMNKSTLSRYENNLQEPMITVVRNLAQIFNVSVDSLLNSDTQKLLAVKTKQPAVSLEAVGVAKKYDRLDPHGKTSVKAILNIEYERCTEATPPPIEFITIRYCNNKASAGDGFYLDDGDNDDEIQVVSNNLTRRADIVVRVSGDSMQPEFFDDDLVLVVNQPDIDIGQDGVFTVNDVGYIKRRGEDELISVNPDYGNITIGEFDECKCIGRVIGVLDNGWIVEQA